MLKSLRSCRQMDGGLLVKKLVCTIAVVCSFLSVNVNAENTYKETVLRCENGIVSIGDAEAMLIVKCGRPLYQSFPSYQTAQLAYITDGFVRVVTIKHGMVKEIITAGRAN